MRFWSLIIGAAMGNFFNLLFVCLFVLFQKTHDSVLERNTKLNQVSLQFKNKNAALTTTIKELETTIETLQAQLAEASTAAAAAAAAPTPATADEKPDVEALQKKIAEMAEKEAKVELFWNGFFIFLNLGLFCSWLIFQSAPITHAAS
jgi:hypothetical protein